MTTWQINNIMTKEKDALLLAEAYKRISSPAPITEALDLDPESWNIISHALAALGTAAAVMVKQKIDAKTKERNSGFERAGSATSTRLDSNGNPVNDGEMVNTDVSPSLQRAKYELNKGKTKIP